MDYTMLSVTFFLLAFAGVSCQIDLEEKCSASGGMCKVIVDCPFALNLISKRNGNIEDNINKLRSIFCGFEDKYPKVCCPPSDPSSAIVYNKSEETATNRPKPKPTISPLTTTTTTTAPSTTTFPELVYRSTEETKQKTEFTEAPFVPEPPSVIDPFPDRRICGQDRDSDRIFGGDIVGIDEFPWVARVLYKRKNNSEMFGCSASLITNRYLISAAHCFSANGLKPVSVRLGDWNTETKIDCVEVADGQDCNEPPVDVEIEDTIVYPGWNRRNVTFGDIALIRLKEPVNFTDFIQPICLPTTEYIKMQDYVRESSYLTAGWGLTEFGETSVVKRKVLLEAVPMDICLSAVPSIPESSSPNLICAGGRHGKDSCRGDSGGPLMRKVPENYGINWYLYGITSFGAKSCGAEGIPGIYTRVTTYMDWIRKVVMT